MATAEEEAEEELQSQLRAAAIHIRARRTRERTPGAPNRSTPERLGARERLTPTRSALLTPNRSPRSTPASGVPQPLDALTPDRATPGRLRTPGAPRTAHPMLSPRSPLVLEEGGAGEGGGGGVSTTPREDARLRSD